MTGPDAPIRGTVSFCFGSVMAVRPEVRVVTNFVLWRRTGNRWVPVSRRVPLPVKR
jgi:hypothetical protein